MPIYLWEDKKSKKQVEVIRSFDDYEKPPTEEEAPDIENPEWERKILRTQKHTKAPGFGAKGYW